MGHGNLTDQEVAFIESLGRQVIKARREGAILGAGYALAIVSLLYTAFWNLGPTHPVSALCYGGVVVVGWDAYRRFR